VVETFFIDWPASFGIGLAFGLAGRREIAAAPTPLRTRAFAYGFAYENLGFLSIALALYAARPDWMWMYWIDAGSLPVTVTTLGFAIYELAFVAGFAMAPALESTRRGAGIALAVATGAGLIAGEVVTRTRLLRFGTIEQFRAGTARGAFEQGVAPEFALLLVAIVASGVALLVLLRCAARRPAHPD
jgi:hypothetical protein